MSSKVDFIDHLEWCIKLSFCLLLSCFFWVDGYAQVKSFGEIRDKVRSLWTDQNYDDAIILLENNRSRFSEGFPEFTTHFYLGLLYIEKENPDRGFGELYSGMDKGYFYSFFPNTVQQIQQYEGSDELLDRNNRLRQQAQDTASIKLEVSLPVEFDASKKYPLIIFLHGNNSSLSSAKSEWKDVRLTQSYMVAFMQSSSPVSSYAYNWPDSERSREDIQSGFARLQNQYAIDEFQVIITGFSAGGRMSIDTILRDILPATGFIAFCPPKPSSLNVSKIQNAIEKGRKGAIISGENDYLLTEQLEMATQFKLAGYRLRVVIHSGQGHEYPKDFEYQLNRSVEFFRLQNY